MTKHDTPRQSDISERQSIAIDLLLIGTTITATAEQIGVSRQTVSDWNHHHLPFIAEMNRRRHQRTATIASRYEHAITLALELVINELEDGDTSHAHHLLKHAATHLHTPPGSVTISGVASAIANDQLVDLLHEATQPDHILFAIEDLSARVSDTDHRTGEQKANAE